MSPSAPPAPLRSGSVRQAACLWPLGFERGAEPILDAWRSLHRLQPEATFQRRPIQSSSIDATFKAKEEGVRVRHLHAIGGLVILLTGGEAAMAQAVPDLKGTWIPAKGAHLLDGPTRHQQSGTVPVPGDDTLRTHTSKFVFRFERQEGRTFSGVLSSAKVSEKVIGAISADGKRFVMTDEDGRFDGTVVDNDTLDYCYAHITPTDRAVACGLLIREK
jgi:hypothetical protein